MNKADIKKAMTKLVKRLYETSDPAGGLWDMPTLAICRPGFYHARRRLLAMYKEAKD